MKMRLFMLVLYVTSMQLAVAGANGEAGANSEVDAKQAEQIADAGLDVMERSWSPEDRDSPDFRTRQLDDGSTEITKVEKRTSSGSTPMEEVLSTGITCVSAKCSPSKKSEQASDTNRQSTDANDQAVQQITNNNNNMANKLANQPANTVVVVPPPPPPPPDCFVDPTACLP